MATPVATRCNSAIRAAYARFLAAGKPKKVALVACMRKLLVVLNAVARIGQPWDERAAEPVSRRLHGQASDRPP